MEHRSPTSATLFKYAVEQLAPVYRALIGAFVEAKERYELRLRPDDLPDRLAQPDAVQGDVLERALDQLVHWGNLKRIPDTSRARNLEEFLRRRSLYQLTPEGEVAERAVREVEAAFGGRGALQTFMLPEIVSDLRELATRAKADDPDPGPLHAALSSLFAKFDELADNASRFMATLNDEIDRGDLADDGFRAYKQAVVVYLDRFISELSLIAPQVRAAMRDIESLGVGRLVTIAASADAAPTPDGADAGAVSALQLRWEGLSRWFVGAGQDIPVMDGLRSAGIDGVRRLLGMVEHINDRRLRRVNRATDLIRLAGWFESSEQAEAHELYRTAFGLVSARHMGAVVDDDSAGPATSWWTAPPAEVAATMRVRGRMVRSGRVGAIADRAEAKRVLIERMQHKTLRHRRAAGLFAGRGPLRACELGHLSSDEFELLLTMLERALGSPAAVEQGWRALTPDGAFELTLSRPNPAGARATVVTDTGTLQMPDFLIDVRPVARMGVAS